MYWNFRDDIPIYLQIAETIKLSVISGKTAAGSRLDSVRDLAFDAGVNPNTMQKALAYLERLNLVYTSRTSGRYVTEDTELINSLKQELAEKRITEFLNQMSEIGFKESEIIEKIKERNDKNE